MEGLCVCSKLPRWLVSTASVQACVQACVHASSDAYCEILLMVIHRIRCRPIVGKSLWALRSYPTEASCWAIDKDPARGGGGG